MSLSLDYEYQRKLADKISKFNSNWEPYQYQNQMSGGSVMTEFVLPGSSAAYPMFNSTTLAKINRGTKTKENAMRGKGVKPSMKQYAKLEKDIIKKLESVPKNELQGGALTDHIHPFLKKLASGTLDVALPYLGKQVGKHFGNEKLGRQISKIIRDFSKRHIGLGMSEDIGIYQGGNQGGKLTVKKIIRKVKPIAKVIAKQVVSKGLDVGVPALGTAVGTYFGNPLLGAQAGLIGRKIIKHQTGYGVPVKKQTRPHPKVGGKKNVSKARSARGEIIKKVMKEHGLKLGAASKYIKENNLY
jgi:hypothetical protein